MSEDQISLLRAAAHPGNNDNVIATSPTVRCRPERCEFPIHIGLFFDGTGNNQGWAEPRLRGATQLERKKDSNVARLYRAYPNQPLEGHYPRYVPGVGTPFPAIGENDVSMLGMGFGAGGDARIVFGLLHVLNAMHRSIDGGDLPMIASRTVQALCSNHWLPLQTGTEDSADPLSMADQRALDTVGMKDQGGLLTVNGFSYRSQFLKQQFAQLTKKIDETRHPKLVEVFIDVFGFSRGAAQARVFCNWLDECFDGERLAGVTTHIRFLGIFDTVAAVGLGPAAGRWANGHYGWGQTENLRISPRVRHCEHYVAMHEQRESFPLEDVQTPGDEMPSRCRQLRFPGMHSDVGGGYLPEEQGKNDCDDANKLARMPLNMMYEAAVAARVPLKAQAMIAQNEGWDAFETSKQLRSDYDAFIEANGAGVRPITDCLIDILAWRYLHRHVYASLPFVHAAEDDDKRDLLEAHEIFLKDISGHHSADTKTDNARSDITSGNLSPSVWVFKRAAAEPPRKEVFPAKASLPEPQRAILERIVQRRPSDVELAFFSTYCHDSYAGFKPFALLSGPLWSRNAPREAGGYLRYRTRYAGESLRLATLQSQPHGEVGSAVA